jgi:hypothetical protein
MIIYDRRKFMKIFGKEFVTRKQLKAENNKLMHRLSRLENTYDTLLKTLDGVTIELEDYTSTFPFKLGQTVYDLQLKNESGRYTKKNASIEHSMINEVIVSEKNYFGLVARYRNHDVFMTYDDAIKYLASACP